MPKPNPKETEHDFVQRCIPIVLAEKTAKDGSQGAAICHSIYREHHKKSMKEHTSFAPFQQKENGTYTSLIASSHPDRVGDILSKNALIQIKDFINTDNSAGGQQGSYRSVSLFHDWIHEKDPTLDEAAFLKPTARVIQLNDGHWGCEVDFEINKFYKEEKMSPEEINYRIQQGGIAGMSIEYDTDNDHSRPVQVNGQEYRFIDSLTEFGGVGFARPRMIANPYAIIYKEIETIMEEKTMEQEQETNIPVVEQAPKEEATTVQEEIIAETPIVPAVLEEKEQLKVPTLTVKEILESKEFKNTFDEAITKLQIKNKIVKETKEEQHMETTQTSLSVKEMKEALKNGNVRSFTDAASSYFAENPQLQEKMKSSGIPLHTTMQIKCDGTKLRIVGSLQTKDILDTSTNPGAYTESPVEFADLFIPGIIETFNNQANLFGALPKRDHLEGGNTYGWRIKRDQAATLSVDPDDTTVVKNPVDKLKVRTDIKEYRVGISVTDYVLHHSRATVGDLFMLESQARMADLMRDINNDLFTEQVDSGTKVIGLEAVADSAGNTSLYGKTRTAANRLAPDTASDTYNAVGGALTSALLRGAMRKVEVDGALRANLRVVVNPLVRDIIFELEDGNLRYMNNNASLGFDGAIRYDGVIVIVDSSAQTDAVFVVDFESFYIVISRPPQLVGLAKVGAAEEAYVSVYLAAIYEKPRRVHMLDTVS